MNAMSLRLTRWGDSLAVKLPDDCVEQTGLRDGDCVMQRCMPALKLVAIPLLDDDSRIAPPDEGSHDL